MEGEVTTNTKFYTTFPFTNLWVYKKHIYNLWNLLGFFKLYIKVEPEKKKKKENVEADRKALLVSSLWIYLCPSRIVMILNRAVHQENESLQYPLHATKRLQRAMCNTEDK